MCRYVVNDKLSPVDRKQDREETLLGAGRLKWPRSRAPHNYSKSPALQPSRRFVTFCDSPNTDGRSQTRHVCRISSSSHLMPSVYCNRLANSGRMQQIDCIRFMGTSHLSSAPLPFRGTTYLLKRISPLWLCLCLNLRLGSLPRRQRHLCLYLWDDTTAGIK